MLVVRLGDLQETGTGMGLPRNQTELRQTGTAITTTAAATTTIGH